MEKSDNELFNQLYEIMKENRPYSNTGYVRNLTDIVCPLVTPEKLHEMIQDEYAKDRTKYMDNPGSIGREGENSWWIERGLLTLIITINQIDNECKAYLYRDAGL